ncbi:hypothetical protein LshimejAT787_0211520 [Lyophyllum shimeji]|uniref:RING-type domain-containing protein n=1 Tax=Lyophyllum shimeji TaxID=47721 RepID=A0A9P3PGF5_LYOSH|nr:hypothetical protein LshimejAT787_0211520 [Lyophyllum shimeji]
MSDPKAQCAICKDAFPVDHFRFLPSCGHGFHLECLQHWPKRRNRYSCATCRRETSEEPIQIYLTFADPPTGDAEGPQSQLGVAAGAEGLERSDTESSAESLKRAARKIRKEAKAAVDDERASTSLLDAVQRLERRIQPVFVDLARERDEKGVLQDEITSLKSRLAELEPMCSRISSLQDELHTAKMNYEKATVECMRERKRRKSLDQTLDRYKRALDKKDGELMAARASLETLNNETRALRTKLKVLAKKEGRQPRQTQDPDDSLQVERPHGATDDVDRPRKKRRTSTSPKKRPSD